MILKYFVNATSQEKAAEFAVTMRTGRSGNFRSALILQGTASRQGYLPPLNSFFWPTIALWPQFGYA
jgi:hypothetical protein